MKLGKKKISPTIIEQAKHCAAPEEIERGEIIGGFAHNQVLALADHIVDRCKIRCNQEVCRYGRL